MLPPSASPRRNPHPTRPADVLCASSCHRLHWPALGDRPCGQHTRRPAAAGSVGTGRRATVLGVLAQPPPGLSGSWRLGSPRPRIGPGPVRGESAEGTPPSKIQREALAGKHKGEMEPRIFNLPRVEQNQRETETGGLDGKRLSRSTTRKRNERGGAAGKRKQEKCGRSQDARGETRAAAQGTAVPIWERETDGSQTQVSRMGEDGPSRLARLPGALLGFPNPAEPEPQGRVSSPSSGGGRWGGRALREAPPGGWGEMTGSHLSSAGMLVRGGGRGGRMEGGKDGGTDGGMQMTTEMGQSPDKLQVDPKGCLGCLARSGRGGVWNL